MWDQSDQLSNNYISHIIPPLEDQDFWKVCLLHVELASLWDIFNSAFSPVWSVKLPRFFLPKEVSPSSTTQTEILCQVSLPLPALPLEGKSTLATLHASCHIRHGRCHAGHGIHSTHWSRIHRSLSKAFGSSFRCHRSSFALTFSRTSGAEKLSTFETKN